MPSRCPAPRASPSRRGRGSRSCLLPRSGRPRSGPDGGWRGWHRRASTPPRGRPSIRPVRRSCRRRGPSRCASPGRGAGARARCRGAVPRGSLRRPRTRPGRRRASARRPRRAPRGPRRRTPPGRCRPPSLAPKRASSPSRAFNRSPSTRSSGAKRVRTEAGPGEGAGKAIAASADPARREKSRRSMGTCRSRCSGPQARFPSLAPRPGGVQGPGLREGGRGYQPS